MDIENEGYLQLLKTKQAELDKIKNDVKLTAITVDGKQYVQIDMEKFEMLSQDVNELEYLKRAIHDGADEAVQFGILNMRLEERQAQRRL